MIQESSASVGNMNDYSVLLEEIRRDSIVIEQTINDLNRNLSHHIKTLWQEEAPVFLTVKQTETTSGGMSITHDNIIQKVHDDDDEDDDDNQSKNSYEKYYYDEEDDDENEVRMGDWLQMEDSEGATYWCNEVTGEACWDEIPP